MADPSLMRRAAMSEWITGARERMAQEVERQAQETAERVRAMATQRIEREIRAMEDLEDLRGRHGSVLWALDVDYLCDWILRAYTDTEADPFDDDHFWEMVHFPIREVIRSLASRGSDLMNKLDTENPNTPWSILREIADDLEEQSKQ